jgi:uncharacterized protein YoxC
MGRTRRIWLLLLPNHRYRVSNPFLWLSLSFLLLAMSAIALLFVAIPTLIELARAARSAEKLCDMLTKELPDTLDALKQTGSNLADLADDMTESMQQAGHVVKQVDQTLMDAKQQVTKAGHFTKSFMAGTKAAWRVLATPTTPQRRKTPSKRKKE